MSTDVGIDNFLNVQNSRSIKIFFFIVIKVVVPKNFSFFKIEFFLLTCLLFILMNIRFLTPIVVSSKKTLYDC